MALDIATSFFLPPERLDLAAEKCPQEVHPCETPPATLAEGPHAWAAICCGSS
jgi:hypothetical protein